MKKYYLDTCIWIDYFENRTDRFRPLGDWALDLINKITEEDNMIIYSDLIEKELLKRFSETVVNDIFSIVPKEILVKIKSSTEQLKEAHDFSKKYNIPPQDALHAILARDNEAILVTRDKHFYELADLLIIKKPEELI